MVGLTFASVLLFWAPSALAFPSFARANDVPCSSCHSSITRRNEFGEVFRLAGYHWPLEEGASPKDSGIELKGVGFLPASLTDSVPLSASATMAALISANGSDDFPLSLNNPALRLMLGAELGRHVSVMATSPIGPKPDELLLHIARIGGRPELNLRLGLLEQSTTLFKNNQALLSRTFVNTKSLSSHTMSVGRLGGELNGVFQKRGFYAAGVVQNAGPGSPADYYYHLGYKFGGMDLLGNEPDVDLFGEPGVLDNAHLQFGHWGYLGRVADDTGDEILHEVRRVGLDVRLAYENLRLQGGTMLGFDKDVRRNLLDSSVTWFAEASYLATSWLTPIYQVQFQDAASLEEPEHLHEVGLIGLLTENLRSRLSFAFSIDGKKNETGQLQLLLAL